MKRTETGMKDVENVKTLRESTVPMLRSMPDVECLHSWNANPVWKHLSRQPCVALALTDSPDLQQLRLGWASIMKTHDRAH